MPKVYTVKYKWVVDKTENGFTGVCEDLKMRVWARDLAELIEEIRLCEKELG
jgi:hypothetical protein